MYFGWDPSRVLSQPLAVLQPIGSDGLVDGDQNSRTLKRQALVNKGRLFRPSEANARQTGGNKANIKP